MKKQLTAEQTTLLKTMFVIRERNNLNWKAALENLMIYAPAAVVANIFEEINENDLRVNEIFGAIRRSLREAE